MSAASKRVASAFTLNEGQRVSFFRIAHQAQVEWAHERDSSLPEPKQLIQLVTGAGGVGKTQVIKALQYFFATSP